MQTRVHKPATWAQTLFAVGVGLAGFAVVAWGVWDAGNLAWHWLKQGEFGDITRLSEYICGSNGNCESVTGLKGVNKIVAWIGEGPAWVGAIIVGWLGVMWGMALAEGEWVDADEKR